MAVWQMTQKTLENTPVDIFNNGETTRSFTYIDDAVDGTISAIDQKNSNDIPYRIYNIGYPTQINLLSLLEIIENAVGKKMIKNFLPAEHVDILESFADISLSKNELGFSPKTSLKEGIQKFVDWYVKYKS